jgi:dUTP pyrophosphatase
MNVKFTKLTESAKTPQYKSSGAAGADLCADHDVRVWAGEMEKVHTGISIELPPGYEAQVRPRSGLAATYNLTVLNSPGTIDSDYRGEIVVLLMNHGPHTYDVKAGDRIAQIVIAPVVQVQFEEATELDETERGADGFGSTGTA